MWDFPLFPKAASTLAPRVDLLYLFLVGVTLFFTLLIFAVVFYMAVRYRRARTDVDRSNPPAANHIMEIIWIVLPLGIVLFIFAWSTDVYFDVVRAPSNALEYHAIGKQWMWKFQHPNGRREVNYLHVPTGRPIRMVMISQDVLHDLFLPAFRVKQDVLPGKYTSLWFEATEPGTYNLFCAEYCGMEHSLMGGKVIVMTPQDYERWLAGDVAGETPIQKGERLFTQYGCNTCHAAGPGQRGPSLVGLYNSKVKLSSGETVTADDDYIHESIYTPTMKLVAGYQALMPSFKGQLGEEEVVNLIAYIKSLKGGEERTAALAPASATASTTN